MAKATMGGAMRPGSKARMMANAAAAQPKMPRQGPAGRTATPKAQTPQRAEMGSGGLQGGISALKANHAMKSPGRSKVK